MDGQDAQEPATQNNRGKQARERVMAEQKKKLDELRAHAEAAQAQQEKLEEERRQRLNEQRQNNEERRLKVEERRRVMEEASHSRRAAIMQRDRERSERLQQLRAARTPHSILEFAFGSSTPRLLMPIDTSACFWATRRTASTSNLTRPASAMQLNVEESDETINPTNRPGSDHRASVARRRTDLVPTIVMPRSTGRAYSMTRLDRISAQRPLHSASPSLHHLNRTHVRSQRSGETSPVSRPGSAMSSGSQVVRRQNSIPRRIRPVSVAVTGVNTATNSSTGDQVKGKPPVQKRNLPKETNKQPVALSIEVDPKTGIKLITNKENQLTDDDLLPIINEQSIKSSEISEIDVQTEVKDNPNVNIPKPPTCESINSNQTSINMEEPLNHVKVNDVDNEAIKDIPKPPICESTNADQLSYLKQTSMNIGLQNSSEHPKVVEAYDTANKDVSINIPKPSTCGSTNVEIEVQIEPEHPKTSTRARRIATEKEAKARLAEQRRKAREELERRTELERQRYERDAAMEAERLRQEEEEARELAELRRKQDEAKLNEAIQAHQLLQREELERKAIEEAERLARLNEDKLKAKALKDAESQRIAEAEREARARHERKERVAAILARARLREAESSKPLSRPLEPTNGNISAPEQTTSASNISANLIEAERMSSENGNNKDNLCEHNGQGAKHKHPTTL